MGLAAMTMPAFAGVETTVYPDYDGINCVNLYNISRNLDMDEFLGTFMNEFNNRTRSMIALDGKLYIAQSRTIVEGESSNDYAHLIVIDQATGSVESRVQLTVNGTPLAGLLCANNIGVDDFGNVWICGLVGNTETTPFRIYHVKDLKTGETELAAELNVPSEEAEAFGRHDYCDLVGDVTGKEAGTVFMSPVASGSDTFVIGFEREQGSDTWKPHMDGYYSYAMAETYPADCTTWDGAPMVRIIRDEDYSGSMFYIDAFVTHPALYTNDGTLIDSFAFASELQPARTGSNGVMEFDFMDKHFIAFTYADYDTEPGSQVRVAEMGQDQAFEGMQLAWDLPKNGLGLISDTGTRMMGICPSVVTDNNGKQGCYLSIFKCYNGLATYLLSEPGFEAGVADITTDETNNAPVEYFDVMGRRIDSPVAGQLYIVHQGDEVSKQMVR